MVRKIGLAAGTNAMKAKYEANVIEYNKNPTICATCSAILPYEKRSYKYCNSSCAATGSNTGRIRSAECRENLSIALTKYRAKIRESSPPKPKVIPPKRTYQLVCVTCGITYDGKTKEGQYCPDCYHVRRISNGMRTKSYEYNGVHLDSGWELAVAQNLDKLNIKWIRPKYIPYEKDGRSHKYFPDFYLPEHDLYLDPKNPFRMKVDKEKMEIISDKVNLLYGDLRMILERLEGFAPSTVSLAS